MGWGYLVRRDKLLFIDTGLQDAYVGKIAVFFRKVQPITHDKEVVYGKTGVVGLHGLGAAGGLIQQRTQPDGGGVWSSLSR